MTETAKQPRYQLDRRIATGGMGEVWQATDTLLDREVAVKVLKDEYADEATFRSRFESEARNAAALLHPNVASVFDFGELPDQDGSGTRRPYLVMELVPGEPLSALLRGGEPMPPATAADLVAQAADGIAAAHVLGIVHRDVKPGNLLVTPAGQVKITDFGIARAADNVALTQTGQVVGTPHYMAPEQAEGKAATMSTDIYSLGVVLYECLAGRRPFNGDTPVTTALAHLREEAPPLPDDVPEHLRRVVAKALAKRPEDRFASAGDLAAALRGGPLDVLPADAPTAVVAAPVAGAAAATAAAATAAAATGRTTGRTTDTATGAGHTQVLTGSSAAPGDRRRRLPGWLPWAALAAAVLLLAGLLGLVGGDASDTAAGSPTATPTASDTPEQVRVRRAAYLGMEADRATERLTALGLQVRTTTRDNPGGHRAGTVADVRPTGLVDPGTTIRLAVWGAEPAPVTKPKPAHAKPPKGPGHGHDHGKPGKTKGKK